MTTLARGEGSASSPCRGCDDRRRCPPARRVAQGARQPPTSSATTSAATSRPPTCSTVLTRPPRSSGSREQSPPGWPRRPCTGLRPRRLPSARRSPRTGSTASRRRRTRPGRRARPAGWGSGGVGRRGAVDGGHSCAHAFDERDAFGDLGVGDGAGDRGGRVVDRDQLGFRHRASFRAGPARQLLPVPGAGGVGGGRGRRRPRRR